ncbi:hypothetical protein BH10PSE7_BH10PSE7_06810 [soil metagenome]
MKQEPSRAIRLFGTDEAVEPPRLLTAGPLTAELENGSLRYISFDGTEVIRAVSFIVRDKNWATYNPVITNLLIEEEPDRFSVSYDAVTRDPEQELRYSAKIEGRDKGTLTFAATGNAVTNFQTNRTGFVVLHPIAGVAGAPATVEEVDGKIVKTVFPELISPGQPIFNMRAITHEFAPGARVACRMEGDTYEMEDQRNWMDASYKTYVRPLSRPWPYTIAPGETLSQKISLRIEGKPPKSSGRAGAVSIKIGRKIGKVPPLGVGLHPNDAKQALKSAAALRLLKPAYIVCHFDPRAGHNKASLTRMLAVAKALKAEPWLEAVVATVNGYEKEVTKLAAMVKALGSPFKAVFLSPAPDMKSTQPTGPWPPAPPLDGLYKLARKLFPKARIGGGMMSFFTELNRKRPPAEFADFINFTNSALVHSGDDRSVTEGLEALPAMAKSVRAFIGDKPFTVGPSAIGMRFNPYGAAPVANPNNIRQAMNETDPRHRGLLGAVWNLGYFAHFAANGASLIALGGLTGPFGVIDGKAILPVFHILRGLAALKGGDLYRVEISKPRHVQALAAMRKGRLELWLANLSGEPLTMNAGSKFKGAKAAILDASTFDALASAPDAFGKKKETLKSSSITLDAYSVCRLTAAS